MYIYCEPFMFDLHQKIYLFSDVNDMREIAVSDIEHLGCVIADACAKYNVSQVKLRVSSTGDFTTNLVNEIYEASSAVYGKNNIDIEVI